MPAWLVTLLTALLEILGKMLNITKRDLAIVVLTLLLCGGAVVVLAQVGVLPFLAELDSHDVRLDSLELKVDHLGVFDKTLMDGIGRIEKSANSSLLAQLKDDTLLTLEERAEIETRLSFSEYVSADSLQRVLSMRKKLALLGRR